MNIVVSGSLAYDRIMDFPGYFAEHILPEKIHMINVCFQVDGVKEKFGGTAGNIAYSLKLMGENPLISAAIGQDHHRYLDWIKKIGLSTNAIRVVEEEFTASAYITTDKADNQITGFNPGAMKYSSNLDFNTLDPKSTLLIISPGNLSDMVTYPVECKERGISYIFDPGQSLPMLSAEDLLQAIEGCRILITNDYELDLIMTKTNTEKRGLLERAGAVITTLGEQGSLVSTREGDIRVPIGTTRQVLDPTGAGDSFRGGLLCGLVKGLDLGECARMGSVCASFSVECYGTQSYEFTSSEFDERLCALPR